MCVCACVFKSDCTHVHNVNDCKSVLQMLIMFEFVSLLIHHQHCKSKFSIVKSESLDTRAI